MEVNMETNKINNLTDALLFQQNVIYKIVEKEEEHLMNLVIDYARQYNSELRLLDEDKVKEIINLGITQYHGTQAPVNRNNYIHKSVIEKKLGEIKETLARMPRKYISL